VLCGTAMCYKAATIGKGIKITKGLVHQMARLLNFKLGAIPKHLLVSFFPQSWSSKLPFQHYNHY